ncbi:MAG: hypothetical protein KatS3mg074_228 [Meiothermus sp.]|uniref:Uncharacterized protein n=2 Tax=Meiothermus hypogaeus TaxID=884155 RepID=A0A511R4C3_9DEIN|nr:DUF4175 domain-containing protein [Meiothermus hypogaeus]RIH76550.1 hypothetical protein Mhypo_02403 [Meiothermus hypogaeus]GEM84405.1 hypothetical protein MHY01S_25710 [Meiothermus hypogaeus NBRC 106114]GIW37830.1 MAG: hypothetical protein KatS3mg074_228 [Meiothermus sp.]
MEGIKPFALWALIAVLVGGLVYLAQWQGWVPGTFPYWALGVVLILALGFANLLARGPR